MNKSAYLTTGLAIKIISSLSKADIVVHGRENVSAGPTIFVINHFTRVETFLLPYLIYHITEKPVWSLAAAELFQGRFGRFLDLMGAVSTANDKRDQLIIKNLLSGQGDWIVFPEGSMVKNKKIVSRGRYMIAHPKGMHEPHTGAAVMALRAELMRRCLLSLPEDSGQRKRLLDNLGMEQGTEIVGVPVDIVPVNLTYYPIRAAENIASDIAARLVKDLPERMVEEIMTEGTMLLSGVDIDVRFGAPILMSEFVEKRWVSSMAGFVSEDAAAEPDGLRGEMKKVAHGLMQRYMHEIYRMTTVNHEHLFASLLRRCPFTHISEVSFKRRVFYAATIIRERQSENEDYILHKSLTGNQVHLLIDDRYGKYANFLQLAIEKGIVEKRGKYLLRNKSRLSGPLSFHRGRLDNPIEVMANEVEPLEYLQRLFRSIIWRPEFLLRFSIFRLLLAREKKKYVLDCQDFGRYDQPEEYGRICPGAPFLLPSFRRRTGVVLVHSYLSLPQEVRGLAEYLRRRGIWVYAPRLPGHGTSAEDLAGRKHREWVEAVENGYLLLSMFCKRVVLGGVALGGNLGLDVAARLPEVAGVFAVCPPYSLKDYSTNFMPGKDVWNRMLNRLKKGEQGEKFVEFAHGNRHVNYSHNPITGIKEIGDYLESLESLYANISQPGLILQADKNPVVVPKGSRKLYEQIGSRKKEFCLLSYDRHVLVNGPGAEVVHRKIYEFVSSL